MRFNIWDRFRPLATDEEMIRTLEESGEDSDGLKEWLQAGRPKSTPAPKPQQAEKPVVLGGSPQFIMGGQAHEPVGGSDAFKFPRDSEINDSKEVSNVG